MLRQQHAARARPCSCRRVLFQIVIVYVPAVIEPLSTPAQRAFSTSLSFPPQTSHASTALNEQLLSGHGTHCWRIQQQKNVQ
jgi:hypothetical protein